MIGKTLKHIREQKGFSAKWLAEGAISGAQLTRIEQHGQTPAADKFISLLYRLNVSYDEFCLLSNNEHAKARIETKNSVADIIRIKHKKQLKDAIKKMDAYYRKFNDHYFEHMRCSLQATLLLIESNHDFEAVFEVLKPISNYLESVETWFEYEITLLSNCIYLYPLATAIEYGEIALRKIKNNYILFNNHELTATLLMNLALYSLTDDDYLPQAYDYANRALALPQATYILYPSVITKILKQVIYYKMGSDEYDRVQLADLIKCFKLLKFHDYHNQIINFFTKHGMPLEELQST